jgi:hypothetical protein
MLHILLSRLHSGKTTNVRLSLEFTKSQWTALTKKIVSELNERD